MQCSEALNEQAYSGGAGIFWVLKERRLADLERFLHFALTLVECGDIQPGGDDLLSLWEARELALVDGHSLSKASFLDPDPGLDEQAQFC